MYILGTCHTVSSIWIVVVTNGVVRTNNLYAWNCNMEVEMIRISFG